MTRRSVACALAAAAAAALGLLYRDAAGALLLGDLVSFCG
jgi:hypothetical protein